MRKRCYVEPCHAQSPRNSWSTAGLPSHSCSMGIVSDQLRPIDQRPMLIIVNDHDLYTYIYIIYTYVYVYMYYIYTYVYVYIYIYYIHMYMYIYIVSLYTWSCCSLLFHHIPKSYPCCSTAVVTNVPGFLAIHLDSEPRSPKVGEAELTTTKS